ncbi:MAG TPA: beta-N-acetylhexosaminidase [Phycisphaerales bacterium]|nr:beta-N-acetylhexosaminidase [Phycisphaerales bacterium]
MDSRTEIAAGMVCVGFDGLRVTKGLRELLSLGVRSVILFARNHESREQTRELCSEIRKAAPGPVMICVDQEGGRVQRFINGFTIIPSMRNVGTIGNEDEARVIGELMTRELGSAGIDLNLAPVLDVDSNPDNPVIGERSFGSDPQVVARMGCAMIGGMQMGHGAVGIPGIAACGKHFPGHGDTDVDSHLALPRLRHDMERLRKVELVPFKEAVEHGIAAIMVSHVVFDAIDPGVPSTMSHKVVHGLLRQELRFDGLVVSDDLEMKAITEHFGVEEAVVKGAIAGIDLFTICHRDDVQRKAIQALTDAMQSGLVSAAHVTETQTRMEKFIDRWVCRRHGLHLDFVR